MNQSKGILFARTSYPPFSEHYWLLCNKSLGMANPDCSETEHLDGSCMQGEVFTSAAYRFGFNGKEKEADGTADNYDFGARIYDGRLGRWLAVDNHLHYYPESSPFGFAFLSPLMLLDHNGNDPMDPRTGKTFSIDMWRNGVAVYEISSTCRTRFDEELFKNAIPTVSSSPTGLDRNRSVPDSHGQQTDKLVNKHDEATDLTTDDQRILINSLIPQQKGMENEEDKRFGGFGNSISAWLSAANSGTYVFYDIYVQSEWLYSDLPTYNVYTVSENRISQIITMNRRDDDLFRVSQVQKFEISNETDVIKFKSHKFLWLSWTTSTSYREYDLITDTDVYDQNGNISSSDRSFSHVSNEND